MSFDVACSLFLNAASRSEYSFFCRSISCDLPSMDAVRFSTSVLRASRRSRNSVMSLSRELMSWMARILVGTEIIDLLCQAVDLFYEIEALGVPRLRSRFLFSPQAR